MRDSGSCDSGSNPDGATTRLLGRHAMKFCPYCGTKNQNKYNFCIKCHESLPDESTPDADETKKDDVKDTAAAFPSLILLGKMQETPETVEKAEKKNEALSPVQLPQKKDGKEKVNIESITVKIMGKDDFAQAVSSALSSINIPKTISKDIRQIITEEERRILKGLENNNREAEELYKTTVLSAESLLKFGNGNFLSGNKENAMVFFEKALEKDPKLWPAWYNKGVLLGSAGKYDDSIKCFDEVLKIERANDDARLAKGICLRSLGMTEQAIECFDAIIASDANNEEVHVRKGIALADLGKYDESIKCFEKALSLNPKSSIATEMKERASNVISSMRKKDEAIVNLKEETAKVEGISRKGSTSKLGDFGLTLNLSNDRLYYNKGMVLAYQGDYEGALKCFDEALKINKNLERAWASKGIAAMALGRLKDVMECFDRAIALNPNDESMWVRRAIVLGDMGKYTEMARCINKALAINSKHEMASKIKERLQAVGHASEELERAVTELYKSGAKMPSLAEPGDAVKHVDLLLIKNPSSEEYWAFEGSLILHDMGSVEDAMKSFDKSLKVNPGFSHAWFNKGMILARLGRAEEAIKCFDEAIKLNPDLKLAWYNRGAILGMLGVYDEALRCFDRAQGMQDTGSSATQPVSERAAQVPNEHPPTPQSEMQGEQSSPKEGNKRIVKIIKK